MKKSNHTNFKGRIEYLDDCDIKIGTEYTIQDQRHSLRHGTFSDFISGQDTLCFLQHFTFILQFS